MKYLLDTNALLWWLSNDISLSDKAQTKIGSPDNLIFVSAVSAWEISIKKAIGKLDAPDDLEAAIMDSRFERYPFQSEMVLRRINYRIITTIPLIEC